MAVEITSTVDAEGIPILVVHPGAVEPTKADYAEVYEFSKVIAAFFQGQGVDVWTDERHGSFELWVEKGELDEPGRVPQEIA